MTEETETERWGDVERLKDRAMERWGDGAKRIGRDLETGDGMLKCMND